MTERETKIVLVTRDEALAGAASASLMRDKDVRVHTMPVGAVDAEKAGMPADASLIVIDLDATQREDLVALQQIMIRLAGATPIIVLTEAFDEAVGRWFLQIRVSDFLRKPVSADELARACRAVLGAGEITTTGNATISTFIPAAGGVGATTLAVEASMQYLAAGGEKKTTCLVDLDFENDACASYLDIEPRLMMAELGAAAERLDPHMLEVMLSQHASGLSLLAAPAHTVADMQVNPETVVRILDVVAAKFETVIIDLPRHLQPWTDDVLRGSDRVFVVTDMTVPGLRCARRMVERVVSRTGGEVAPRVIVNRFEKGLFFSGSLSKNDVEKALNGSFAGGVANNYQLVRQAIDRGVPLDAIKPGNNIGADLKRILFA